MPELNTDKTIPVRVAVRIRPLVPKEIADGCQECITVTPGEAQIVMGNDKAFTYDYVCGSTTKQSDLYEQTVEPLIDGLFKGYNATVLAYGQTGSGKTYSMGTSFMTCTNTNDKEIQGVIPRVVCDIFEHIEKKKEETEYLLKCSFLEIHNEEIHDLLNPASSTDKIAIRENVDGGIKIAGLLELPVSSREEMVKFLCNGSASRATGATAMNSTSSRSHAIFSIVIEQKDKTGEGDFRRAKFHLVDLAGSERVKRTNAQGERFKEGVNINRGLLALGNVISALSDEQRKSNAHVPYRDSKLTRLLQDSLGGNSNTVMIACVSPADSNYEETLNTLRYADRARQIKNKPIVNRDPVAAEMNKLKQQVQMLQLQLLQGQTINGGLTDLQGCCSSNEVGLNQLAEHIRQLEEENIKLSQELHNSVNQNTNMYEKVLMAELMKDKIVRQYDELKHYLTDHKVKLMPNLTESSAEEDEETNLATELQKKFHYFEESCTVAPPTDQHNDSQGSMAHDHGDVESMEQDCVVSSPVINSSYESQHALRQAELGRQVQQLTNALSMKQELAVKMQQNKGAMNEKMVKQYEVTVRELETEISKLEKEKSDLALALSAAKTSSSEGVPKGRLRIKELEAKIIEMKKKQVELQKLQRLKQQSDATITKLNTEIQGMKSIRVKLMRQMKEESERFRVLKKEKEKEIMQLKQKDRKRQFEYSKLQNIHQKQQAVLKRKTEEVSAANRRLHEALSKRKEAADRRENNQNLQNKQSEGLIPRMKSWLSHEVEVLASIAHAKKTLEELIEDRKTISHQLSELRGQDSDGQPPAKKMLPMREGESKESDAKEPASEMHIKIKSLEAELTIKTSQIAELQRKLLDAETHVSSEKSKHRWNNIHTMAEGKASLQVLLSMAVNGKSKQIKMEKDVEGDRKELDELRTNTEVLIINHRKKLDYLRCDYDKKNTTLQKQHEDKVLLILQQLPSKEEKTEICRLRKLIEIKDNEIVEKQQENDMLQQRFVTLSEALSHESSSIIEVFNASHQEEDIIVEDMEDEVEIEEEEEGAIDNKDIDPDWVETDCEETPIVRRKKSIPLDLSGPCLCTGKCTRNCVCKKNAVDCGTSCRCKLGKCCNRPKDPKTPIVDSSDSDLSIEQENVSPLTSKPKKQKRPSKESKILTAVNPKVTPNAQERKTYKVSVSRPHAHGRENTLPSTSSWSSTNSEKFRRIRRKSGVLSKKQGIKSTSSAMMIPHRAFLRTPGTGMTPQRTTPKIHSNLNKKNVQTKQRKRKLHNPSIIPPFLS